MTIPTASTVCTAFNGTHRLASGDVRTVAAVAKRAFDDDSTASILIFDDTTARPVEIDLRGTTEDVLDRLPSTEEAPESADSPQPKAPGRPRLGVVGREVTLLPRHWEWLANQPGGASVTLRKLVENAKRSSGDADRIRNARDTAYRFMLALAGDAPGFEEATRALYAGDGERFGSLTAQWPEDVREYATLLAEGSWQPSRS